MQQEASQERSTFSCTMFTLLLIHLFILFYLRACLILNLLSLSHYPALDLEKQFLFDCFILHHRVNPESAPVILFQFFSFLNFIPLHLFLSSAFPWGERDVVSHLADFTADWQSVAILLWLHAVYCSAYCQKPCWISFIITIAEHLEKCGKIQLCCIREKILLV